MELFTKRFIAVLLAMTVAVTAAGQERILRGFDGGMMLHTGYLWGAVEPLGQQVAGAPVGIGGVARIHLGEHWRVGCEGYVSSLHQFGNGSYLKYGWGGFLGDFNWTFGRFMPFVGLTLGGGAHTDLLMLGEEECNDWTPLEKSYYNKQAFFAVDPFIGCDFIVSDAFHLTLKADWLNAISKTKVSQLTGPRIYFGFIFYH